MRGKCNNAERIRDPSRDERFASRGGERTLGSPNFAAGGSDPVTPLTTCGFCFRSYEQAEIVVGAFGPAARLCSSCPLEAIAVFEGS